MRKSRFHPVILEGMHLLRWLTAPFAPLYGAAVALRNRSFDTHPERAERVPLPVVSVGNLSTGGTGKSPLTLHLAQQLAVVGWPNVIVSRGYRGKRAQDPLWVDPAGDPTESGDEPMMMARRLGPGRVIVARRRLAGAQLALSASEPPHCLLLDDGFQHRQLHRDLDLLLLDGARLWGNGRMLPLGDLREPMASAARAQALVVTRSDRADRGQVEAWWAQQGSGGPIFFVEFRIGPLRPLGNTPSAPVPGERLAAFCGLGHPEAFHRDLMRAGFPLGAALNLGDHRSPTPAQLRDFAARARSEGALGLVCTEKDAVKLEAAHLAQLPLPLWIAEQEVLGAEGLVEFVVDRLRAY